MSQYFSLYDDADQGCIPTLGYRERMIGFLVCLGLGYFLQLLSFGQLISALTGHPERFAITYTLGNIIAVCGTGFIVGFKQQFENMRNEERKITSLIFISSMVLTLFSAFVFHSSLLVIIFLIIQMAAYIWYCASYIPFARSCIKNCINGVFGKTIIRD
ncbi:hypothetical protein PPERSA_03096 [Pseudocohnilembus persalinus]|uniref:Vesicle transport protein n=1 Tax=Pseudocohnilembus persalinus TaxID=266149 RepID=A0A0V0R8S0_PSEPJ|nr:hypothetical protein PPERSA_03096 [Pseudocohnilembus persalinus]|eukprot:KRX10879.1 hypothetical protein PPERSA_03096 [Pseudocohnilembus persalinus]